MRTGLGGIFLLIFLSGALHAQSTPASRNATPSAAPKMLQITLPPLSTGAPEATSQLDAYLFLPKSPLANPSIVLPKETRTPAQLEAVLANYTGRWRGESVWFSLVTGHTLRALTEIVYTQKKENGRNVLHGLIYYDLPTGLVVTLVKMWVEKGCIFSEIYQGDRSQRFVAQTNANSLILRTYDEMDTLVEYGEVETLRLTPDGGQLSSHGYQIQHYARGQSMVIESAELKLVK